MIDLKQLMEDYDEATIDKVDLFDFYNKNFHKLVEEIRMLRKELKLYRLEEEGNA